MINATALVVARDRVREVEVGAAEASTPWRPRCTPTSTCSVSVSTARLTTCCPSGRVTRAGGFPLLASQYALHTRRARRAELIDGLIGVFAAQSPGSSDDLVLLDSTPVE